MYVPCTFYLILSLIRSTGGITIISIDCESRPFAASLKTDPENKMSSWSEFWHYTKMVSLQLILCRCASDFSSREEAGYGTQVYPRSRSNSRGCPLSEIYFDTERYAARAIQSHSPTCLRLPAVGLGRLAANYTLCVDDGVVLPFFYITIWYGS